ncbi:T9SS type A sorting domain-containing protein [Winogradskyella forsetii]|uniref:T9SS type A sorting domain-containing protein n=1 Tax=Winogradskyella forsetii TaxID=2686077 RepID=UPI0015B81904|nr:T9SS type A sorting domain-containing protein [Winogradskyella forsetii]
MKKITFLFTLLVVALGYSQAPTEAAPNPPARDAADVISIFTQTTDATTTVYNDLSVADFNPNWGSTSGNVTIDPQGGDRALTYPNFDYQGIIIGSNINVGAMTKLHVDIWTNSVSPNVYLISNTSGERFVNVASAPNQWTSVEIDLSEYTSQGLTLNDIKEFKFATDSGASGVSIYIDNLYFSRPAVDPLTDATLSDLQIDGSTIPTFGPNTTSYTYSVPTGTTTVPQITTATTTNASATAVITQASAIPGSASVAVTAQDGTTMQTYTVAFAASGPATAAPAPPARTPQNVISIFSDAYNDIAIDTYDTPWCGATTTEVMIEGDAIKQITGLGCEGIEFVSGRFDASGFGFFHMDIFTESETMDKSFNIKFSDWQGGAEEEGALEYSATNANVLPATNPGTWISIDLPLSAFSVINGVDGSDLVQFVITSDLGTVYYDNLYLHNNNLSTNEFAAADFKVYPNPTKNNWNVESNTTITSISVYDILGKRVSTLSPNTNDVEISTENIQSGIYFARIEGSNGSKTVKLIKE